MKKQLKTKQKLKLQQLTKGYTKLEDVKCNIKGKQCGKGKNMDFYNVFNLNLLST